MAMHEELENETTVVKWDDPVNHPNHYNVVDRLGMHHECIDVLEALHLNFFTGNAFKYLWRAGRKDRAKTIEDLKKAIFYLNREVEFLESDDT